MIALDSLYIYISYTQRCHYDGPGFQIFNGEIRRALPVREVVICNRMVLILAPFPMGGSAHPYPPKK